MVLGFAWPKIKLSLGQRIDPIKPMPSCASNFIGETYLTFFIFVEPRGGNENPGHAG